MAAKVYESLNKNKNKKKPKIKKTIRENFSSPIEIDKTVSLALWQSQQDTATNNWVTFTKWVIGDFVTTLFITLVGTNMVFFTMLPTKYQDQLFPTDRDKCPYTGSGCPPKCGVIVSQSGGAGGEGVVQPTAQQHKQDYTSDKPITVVLVDDEPQLFTKIEVENTAALNSAERLAEQRRKDRFDDPASKRADELMGKNSSEEGSSSGHGSSSSDQGSSSDHGSSSSGRRSFGLSFGRSGNKSSSKRGSFFKRRGQSSSKKPGTSGSKKRSFKQRMKDLKGAPGRARKSMSAKVTHLKSAPARARASLKRKKDRAKTKIQNIKAAPGKRAKAISESYNRKKDRAKAKGASISASYKSTKERVKATGAKTKAYMQRSPQSPQSPATGVEMTQSGGFGRGPPKIKKKVLMVDDVQNSSLTNLKRTLGTALREADGKLREEISESDVLWQEPPQDGEPGKLKESSLSSSGYDWACEGAREGNVKYSIKGSSFDELWRGVERFYNMPENRDVDLKKMRIQKKEWADVAEYLIKVLNIPESTKMKNIHFKRWSSIQEDPRFKQLRSQMSNQPRESKEKLLNENYRFMITPPFIKHHLTNDSSPCTDRKMKIEDTVLNNPMGKSIVDKVIESIEATVHPIGQMMQDGIMGTARLPINIAKAAAEVATDQVRTVVEAAKDGDAANTAAKAALLEAQASEARANATQARVKTAGIALRAKKEAAATDPVATPVATDPQVGGGSCPPGSPNAEYECRDWASMFSKQNSATCRAVDNFTEEWMCFAWPYTWISPPIANAADASRKSQGFTDTIFSTQRYNNRYTSDSMKTFCGSAFAEYWIFIRAIFKWFLRLFKRDGAGVNPLAADIFPIIIGFFIIVPLILSGFIHFLAYGYSTIKNFINLFFDIGAGWVIKGKFSILWLFILFFMMTPLWMVVGSIYGIVISPVRMMFTLIAVPWLISSRMCKDIVKCNISTFMMIFGALVVKSAYLSLTSDSFSMMAITYILLAGFSLFSSRASV